MIEPIFFYATIFAICLLGVVFVLLAFLYHRELKKFYSLWEEQEKSKGLYTEAEKVLASAKKEALNIISKANLLASTDRKLLQDSLDKITSDEVKAYKQMVNDFRLNLNKATELVTKDLRTQSTTDLNRFHQGITEELVKYQTQLQSNMDKYYQEIIKSMDSYKVTRIAEIDKKVADIVKDTAKQVIRLTITPEENTEIIIRALEEAKKRNEL